MARRLKQMVQVLHTALTSSTSPHTKMLHQEWLRLFGAIYGEPSKGKTDGTKALLRAYELDGTLKIPSWSARCSSTRRV
jgi:hypothetical protein